MKHTGNGLETRETVEGTPLKFKWPNVGERFGDAHDS